MHQHRRRKKRPSYGVRTVEISRGKNGFGFTISGQAPCILSCIITGSPAEKAGLRPGDFLIAVNGQNVSKAPHDDVVRLIGNSSGILKLQIAENYYSDSSEEEFVSVVKLRPKYPNKTRNKQQHNSVSRAEKVVQDLQTGALFVDHIHGCEVPQKQRESSDKKTSVPGTSRCNKVLLDLILKQRLKHTNYRHFLQTTSSPQNGDSSVSSAKTKQTCFKKREAKVFKSYSHPEHLNNSNSVGEVFHSIFTEQDLNNILYPTIFLSENNEEQKGKDEQVVLKAVVGYLGTIEMPKEPQLPNSRLQTIRNCIRRLRVEKKVHTLVLMSVFPDSIILINPQGVTLAEFSADKITFSGVYSDDKKFFGLVTNHGVCTDEFSEGSKEDPGSVSSSCHVFMVDPKLTPHHQHMKRAKAFHITCTSDPITNKCKEFPESAESILQAVVSLYRNKLVLNNEVVHGFEFHVNMSPQPSNTSSNSSNSDSGIGFRDEGNASDRVFVVDVDNYHQYSTNSLDRQAFSTPGFGLLDSPLRSFSLSQDSPLLTSKSTNHSHTSDLKASGKLSPCPFNRLTVRAMPDPVGFERNCPVYNKYSEQPSTSTNRNNLQNLIPPISDTSNCDKDSQNVNQLGSSSSENLLDMIKVDNKKKSFMESHIEKLSPKVYGLNFPIKSLEDGGLYNTSVDSLGWDLTSCSTEELTSQSRHLALEIQDTTEQEEDGSQDVHPPTQEEDSESEVSGTEHGLDLSRKSGRTSSLRRNLDHKRSLRRTTHEAGTVSDGELASGKVSICSSMLALDELSDASHLSSNVSERPVDVGRVGSWAAGFNILLEDPAGLHTFSEFLKKEFSQENITFWIACERYRQLKDPAQMAEVAKEIYSKHLCIGAQEPVNVDSHARQVASEGLESPSPDLFLSAQKQIFNLMKFDCYQRFLKSTMFKECMLREVQGQPLLFQGQKQEDYAAASEKQKVSGELKKRKSLIPWHKLSKGKSNESKAGGSKIWDRHSEIRKSLKKKKKDKELLKLDDASSTHSDMTDRSSLTSSEPGVGMIYKNVSSRESLNSAELALFPSHCGTDCYYCRVILPDLSTTVVKTQKGETVGEMLLKLLEKRSLTYNAIEAYLVGSSQPLDHGTDVTSLSCKEVKVEQVILFCVELPNKKTIGVKSKSNKTCADILKPVLQKYGFKMDQVTITFKSSQKYVDISAPLASIDNQRIIIKEMLAPALGENKKMLSDKNDSSTPHSFPDLEELTNQIFDDLLKSRPEFEFDGLRVIDLHKKPDVQSNQFSKSHMFHTGNSKIDEKTGAKNNMFIINGKIKSSSQSSKLVTNLPCEIDQPRGKENCSGTKKDANPNVSFQDVDIDYGLASAIQNIEQSFSSSIAYPGREISDNFFPRSCYASNNYEKTDSAMFLQNLGIVPSAVGSLKSKHIQWPSSKSLSQHLNQNTPRPPPRLRSLDHKDPYALSSVNSSPSPNMDSTLIANESFELDLDVDVTLRVQSDESLSPPPCFNSDVGNQIDDSVDREIPKDSEYSRISLHRLSCDPPPVPPKAVTRGPPPRPPSRQLVHLNPAFCLSSSEDVSDDDSPDAASNTDLSLQMKANYIDIGKDYGEFNISFV